MSFFVGAVGFVAGVLGIVSFGENHLPEQPSVDDPEDPNKFAITLRVQVGLDGTANDDGDELADAGGLIFQVIHYNNNMDVIASGSGTETIESGNFYDHELQTTNGNQATMTEVRGDADSMCIATMATTWSDGSKFAWTGDWGDICGLPSFYSGIELENGESPLCTWIVMDMPDISPAWSLGISWSDFAANEGDEPPSDEEAQEMCGSSLQAWNIDKEQILAPNESPAKKRGIAHYGRSDDRLIVSSRHNQSASALCARAHSYGPDFVSLEEGVYCNMETRETLPVCGEGMSAGTECFDVDTATHITYDGAHKPFLRARNPTKVIHW